MPVVQGVKEKVHLPIYDSLTVRPKEQLKDAEPSSTLKFFINVQRKTKLETNLQSASLLPHYNTFEARAMRVVISDLPPEFPDDIPVDVSGVTHVTHGNTPERRVVDTDLQRLMELIEEARENDNEQVIVFVKDRKEVEPDVSGAEAVRLSLDNLVDALEDLDRLAPPKEQIVPNNGGGTLIGKLIYNTVTTFYVGEKIMIQMPTWFFPAGAGPYSEAARFTTHGEPSPTATFRFAEPIFIDRQQNFRVEIEIPDADAQKQIGQAYGPLFIWVVLDGYMTRDVQ
jgi:hypothetical protein